MVVDLIHMRIIICTHISGVTIQTISFVSAQCIILLLLQWACNFNLIAY